MKTMKVCGAFCGILAGVFAWNSLYAYPEFTSAASELSVDINVTVQDTISISVDNSNLALDITPSVAGTTGSVATDVEVMTNNLAGYTLTVATNSTESALINDKATTKIEKINTAAELANINNNTWGYLGEDNLYHAVPSSSEVAAVLKKTTSTTEETTSALRIGAKVDNSISAGDYSNTIVLTAVANH